MTTPETHAHPTDNHDEDRASAENEKKVRQENHKHRDERLDEGVEETFPASDPVAVKHIS